MLRKIFTKNGLVVALSSIGSEESDVTYAESTASFFITDDSINIGVGYSYDGVNFVAPSPVVIPIAVTQNQIWENIKKLRDNKTQNNGYQVSPNWYHSDTFSRTQQMGLVMMGAGIPDSLQWKTMDGTFATMTLSLANQVFAAAAASDQALFSYAETLRSAVYAAEDPTTVDITTGWPLGYGE